MNDMSGSASPLEGEEQRQLGHDGDRSPTPLAELTRPARLRSRAAADVPGGIDHPAFSGDIVAHLKARLAGLTRTLALAQDAIGELRCERVALVSALRERDQKIAALQAELDRARLGNGLAEEVRNGLRRLLMRENALAGPATGPEREARSPTEAPTITMDCQQAPGEDPPGAAIAGMPGEQARDATGLPAAAEPDDVPPQDLPRGPVLRNGCVLRRYLIPLEPEHLKVLEFAGPRSCIGRGTEADLCVADPTVSRLHGVLYLIGGAMIVEDARSTNGTFVNGQRVRQATVKDGDEVAFGAAKFQFRVGLEEAG